MDLRASEIIDLKITDLNDDCLIGIFKYLKFKDLFTLFHIHKRFHCAIAGALQHVRVEIYPSNTDAEWEKIERFLKVLGNKIPKLGFLFHPDVEGFHRTNKLIQDYCSNGNVKDCMISDTCFHTSRRKEFFKDNINFFKSLKTLFVPGLPNDDFKTLLQITTGLKQLHCFNGIDSCDINLLADILSLELEKLYIRCLANIPQEKISGLPVNSTIKELTLYHFNDKEPSLFNRFQSIESFTLDGSAANVTTLLSFNLEKLKKLDFFATEDFKKTVAASNFEQLFFKLADFNNLEELNFVVDVVPLDVSENIAMHLSRMTKLKVLDLSGSYTSLKSYLFRLAFHLGNLQKYVISIEEDIDIFVWESIVIGVASLAKNLKKLVLYQCFAADLNYHELYAKLVRVRENKFEHVFYIEINDSSTKDLLYENKWVQMSVR